MIGQGYCVVWIWYGVWISNVLVRVGCLCVGLVGREV